MEVGEFDFRFIAIDLGVSPSPDEVAAAAEAVRPIVGPQAGFEDAGEQGGGPVMTTLDFVAGAMIALAAAVATGGLTSAGLLMARTMTRAAEDMDALRPLGMTGGDRARAATIVSMPAVAASGVLALAVAVAVSAFGALRAGAASEAGTRASPSRTGGRDRDGRHQLVGPGPRRRDRCPAHVPALARRGLDTGGDRVPPVAAAPPRGCPLRRRPRGRDGARWLP